jgi:hypothetical protein
MPIPLGIFAVAGAGGGAAAPAYELISTTVLTSTSANITFSSIPSTYKHLQLRNVVRSTGNNEDNYRMTFNGVGGTAYADHFLSGDGASVVSSGATNMAFVRILFASAYSGSPSAQFASSVIDIVDYASTTKNKTVKGLSGEIYSGQRTRATLFSGLWNNTSAISSITLVPGADSFQIGSRFSLYGIKG